MQHQAAPVAEPTPVTPPPTPIPQAESIIYNHVTPQASTGYTPMAIVQPTTPDEDIKLVVNPYPTMNQSVLQPLSQPMNSPATATPQPGVYQQPTMPTPETVVEKQPEVTIPEPVSPAIIDLANNHADLSVESIQREANRIKLKEESEEVVISLR